MTDTFTTPDEVRAKMDLDEFRSKMDRIEVKSEPLTYSRYGNTSYFADRIAVASGGDNAAQTRLDRHAREMDVEMPRIMRRLEQRAADRPEGVEFRVNPSRTTGQGGYFAPPGWLIEQFVTASRPGRVLANQLPWFPLPDGAQSINLPKLPTGNTEGAVADLGGTPDTDILDNNATSNVVTIAGQADVALQLLEQSPPGAHLDWAMFKDLSEAYDAQLETQLINGSTSLNQIAGVMGLATGSNAIVYTTGSPSFNAMYQQMGQAAAAVGDNRKLPPEFWLMRTARWAWIASSLDNQLRPICPPDTRPLAEGTVDADNITAIMGWPVYVSDAIPANLGAAANQDSIIVMRGSGIPLFEGVPNVSVKLEVLSGTLQARLQWRNYAAAVASTYSSAVATVTGTGMVVPSGF